MSQWTHVLGVVRFDSMSKNVWPEPPNKDELLKQEIENVSRFFQDSNIPSGSEGPIELETILTGRGPTVLLTGDLRDFGREDLEGIVNWLNGVSKKIKEEIEGKARSIFDFLFIRDAIINCRVEYDESIYLIQHNDGGSFELLSLEKKNN